MPGIVLCAGDQRRFNIDQCPRCGAGHTGLELLDFAAPVANRARSSYLDPVVFHAYGTCPVTLAPILISDGARREHLVRMAPSEDKQAAVAYRLWQLDGRRHGRHELHWYLAGWLIASGLAWKMATVMMMREELAVGHEEFADDLLSGMLKVVYQRHDAPLVLVIDTVAL